MPETHVIGSGLTDQQLELASWWVRHQMTVRRALYGALIGFIVLTWGYTLWALLDVFAISYPKESRIERVIAANQLNPQALSAFAPQPIQLADMLIFSGTDNRQDFLTQVSNPNPLWWAEFSYHFEMGETQTPTHAGYLLPESQRYLSELGWKGAAAGNAQIKIENITWHRVDPAQTERDYTAWSAKRLQLAFDNVAYKNDLKLDHRTVGQTSFLLRNPSAFGFWAVDLTVVLRRSGSPVAITMITERELKPGEARPITLNWFENLPNITETEIRASVNVLDSNAYLPTTRF